MKKYPKVSLLILNWNGIAFTVKCLDSLLKTKYPNFEIVLLDNGSINDEADILRKKYQKKGIKVISSNTNIGYAAGMNKAYKASSGEYIMILNNDMEFEHDWLYPLVEVLTNNENVGACQPKIKDLKNKSHFEYSVAAGGFIDLFGYTFARGRIFSHVEKDRGQYDESIDVCWSGVMLIKKEVLKKTGFFDPIYFNYTEDVDLSYRIYGQGYRIVYVPTSIVYHYGGAVLGKNLAKKMFFIHRNHLILILKNWQTSNLLILIIPRILLDVASIFYYLFTGYWEVSLSVIKAYLSLFLLIPSIIKLRIKTQAKLKRRAINENMPIYKGSVVLDYFLLKKRLFRTIMINHSKIIQ